MPLTLYQATVPSFIRHLNALSIIIDKAEAYQRVDEVRRA